MYHEMCLRFHFGSTNSQHEWAQKRACTCSYPGRSICHIGDLGSTNSQAPGAHAPFK